MRLIAKFDLEERAQKFLRVLRAQEIEGYFEKEDEEFRIWVIKEDQVASAVLAYQDFLEGKEQEELAPPILEKLSPGQIPVQNVYLAPLTRFFIFICSIIFLASTYQSYQLKNNESTLYPVFTKVQQNLMYDFPKSLEYLNELTQEYAITKDTKLDSLPEPGKVLLKKIEDNPIWPGYYYVFLNWKDRAELLRAKLFTNILEGEIWRIFTPTLLHTEILHLLFNMLWLWMLGKMIEKNLKIFSYIVFIAVTAVVTNTIQYLTTGPFFMGFSGVVSAMAGYIWVRKKRAPWEIYPIDYGTLIFLWVFIFGMLALQVVAFFLEILHILTFQLNLANAAHVSGVFMGMILGRVKVFQRKT